jgi:DNA repair protein RecO (recombination protein O)
MRTDAIIIKKQQSGEYNQLVTCYTQEFGKITAIAKSSLKAHSKQAMHLDSLHLVDFELINGRATPIIAATQSQKIYHAIKNHLPAMGVAYFFLEVLDKIVFDHQADQNLWNFYLDLLNALETDPNQATTTFFHEQQNRLLKVLGYNQVSQAIVSRHGIFSGFDAIFEQTATKQFGSLKFLYAVL